MLEARRRAADNVERQRRAADEAQQRELDEKRRRVAEMPQRAAHDQRAKQYGKVGRFAPHELHEIENVFADLDRGGIGAFDQADLRYVSLARVMFCLRSCALTSKSM